MSFPTLDDARKRIGKARTSKRSGKPQQVITDTKTGANYVNSQHAARVLGIDEKDVSPLLESGRLVRKSTSPWYVDRIHQRQV